MLVLNRNVNQGIVIDVYPTRGGTTAMPRCIDATVTLMLVAVGDQHCRLGVNAPDGLKVLRAELKQQGC